MANERVATFSCTGRDRELAEIPLDIQAAGHGVAEREGHRVLVLRCQNKWCFGFSFTPAPRSRVKCKSARFFSRSHTSSERRSGCRASSSVHSSRASAHARSWAPLEMRPAYLGSKAVVHQRKRSMVSPAFILTA
eukprot:1282907-Pyramimonas_sp.AAC.1